MSTETTTPIEIGTRVICWTSGGAGTLPHYALTKVVKVNKKTFKVVPTTRGDEPPFSIEADARGQREARLMGGAWAPTRNCAPWDTPLGAEMRARMNDHVALNRAVNAARMFEREPDDAHVLDIAIRELTALRAHRAASTRPDGHIPGDL